MSGRLALPRRPAFSLPCGRPCCIRSGLSDLSKGIMMSDDLLLAQGLKKSYHKHRLDIPVLQGVDLAVPRGGFASIVGASGSGKSTLLHLLGTLDRPDE